MGDILKGVTKRIEAALKLLTSEQADAIIGAPGSEYKTLIQGAQAEQSLMWELMKRNGVKDNDKTRDILGKHMSMVLTIVHYAYALGVQKGKGKE